MDEKEWPVPIHEDDNQLPENDENEIPAEQMVAQNDAVVVDPPAVDNVIYFGQPASPDGSDHGEEIDATFADVPYVLQELDYKQIHHPCYQEFAIDSPPTPYVADCFSPTYSPLGLASPPTSPVYQSSPYWGECISPAYSPRDPVSPPRSPVFQPSPPHPVASPNHARCPCNAHHSNPDDEYPTLDEIDHQLMEEGVLAFDYHTNFGKYWGL